MCGVAGWRRRWIASASARRFARPRFPHRISINVHPSTLGEGRDFVAFLLRRAAAVGVDPKRLIVEIGEQPPAADAAAFRAALCSLREAGIALAVDDVGYGHSNYKTILDCAPQFLKIDRYFVHDVASDRARRAVVQSICDLAGFFGATVIAEGVERQEDHEGSARLRDLAVSGIPVQQAGRRVRRSASASDRRQDSAASPVPPSAARPA